MNVQKIPVRGTSRTLGDAPRRAIVAPLLPMDGAFSISGTILAVDASAACSVEFHPRFGGSVVAGKVIENDMGPLAAQPLNSGSGQGSAPGALRTTIAGRQLEVMLTGIDCKTIDWAWDLEVILFSVAADTGVEAVKKPAPGSAPGAPTSPSPGSAQKK